MRNTDAHQRLLVKGSGPIAGGMNIASPMVAKEINMAKDTHVTAPTRFIEANGIRYAYRRFGAESGTPLVFLQHFRGGLDNWDPIVTDGLAQGRPVILFNNAGVASSSGETPNTIDAMGDHSPQQTSSPAPASPLPPQSATTRGRTIA